MKNHCISHVFGTKKCKCSHVFGTKKCRYSHVFVTKVVFIDAFFVSFIPKKVVSLQYEKSL